MVNFFEGIINPHDKKIKQLEKRADNILAFEEKFKTLTDEELKKKTEEFKNRLKNGQNSDDILEEAFAVVREASFRVFNMKHYKVQLMGGICLHEGNIAQMKTGEGKTLVVTLPTYLNALTGEGVFVITANEYLALRDKQEMGKLYEFLGLTVGLTNRELNVYHKKEVYNCDIVYGTNSEFGFDYLKDNMVTVKQNVVQTRRNFAIIDEVDSILIDDARTPLIITGDAARPSQYYITVDKFIKSLQNKDYEIDNEKKVANLTQIGIQKSERIFGIDNIADIKNTELYHHIRQSLQANYVFTKDKDYLVEGNEVMIIDKFTGRALPGRRFGKGLHQALEAKENVEIKKETKTQAMITYQNYFKLFNKIAGMTGTAYSQKQEFKSIYNVDVICIPTNKEVKRIDKGDLLFKTKEAKFKALINEVQKRHKKGQPILIGTIYIDESEVLSRMLTKNNIKHKILNAKQNKDEAEIISNAGQREAVTIATNMAGRGTDIKLGDKVSELGGLYVIGTERHDSRRIDNQLRGRSGRQGDPGESQFFISLEDSLFSKVGKEALDRIVKVVDKMNLGSDDFIQDKLVSQAIDGIQKTVENTNYNVRKNTLEFDQILNKQRETIYNERNKILNGEDMSEFIYGILKDTIDKNIDSYTSNSEYPEEWDLDSVQNYLNKTFKFNNYIDFTKMESREIENLDKDDIKKKAYDKAIESYKEKVEITGKEQLRYLERVTLMKNIDDKWTDHLDVVDQIRQGIIFQHIGGQNPVRIFNKEAYDMFSNMLEEIKENSIESLFIIANINEELDEVKKIKREHELNEEQRMKRVEELEDKYRISRWFLSKIPSNIPNIKLNVDINATEEVAATVSLYYMDNGYEEKLEEYDKDVKIKGIYVTDFEKPKDKNWNMGWYQIKIFVSKQEVKHIDFIVDKPSRELEAHNLKNIIFFENQKELFIDTGIDCYEENIKGELVYNKNEKTKMKFEIPGEDNKVKIKIRSSNDLWKNGYYEVSLYKDNEKIIIPFIVADKYTKEQGVFTLNLKSIKKDKKEVIGELISIENNKILSSIPIKLDENAKVSISFKSELMQEGRYEFRLIENEDILCREIFIIG
ncbi:MAG: preprotein translocase subunit SecA [Tepidibacter sp.]|jgi:preprotein translocase subunit SecA|uniref:preprotein translocase subunit SecA n=1 Tax=Tepidibacter sp. TaxID=2529387 RepID=UPI0025E8986F|nr:preprotein translocase subunit SecA [Tepidibacter sp.]MCT4507661.1 preprotein translocase subunit SecA [Tepidibacter sp.]